MLDHPLELPPNGFLLADLDYIPEPLAAVALDTAPQTLIRYRKLGCGPEYILLGRRILYSRAKLQAWLEAGGTRGCEDRILNPVSVVKPVQPDEREARPKALLRHQQGRRTQAARPAMAVSVEAGREGERRPAVKRKQSANRVMKQAVQG